MLSELQKEMNRVRVSAPTYQDLVSLYYLKKMLIVEKDLSVEENFNVYKNFCDIYKNIQTNEDVTVFMKKINSFRKELKSNGIRVEDLKNNKERYSHSITVSFLIEMIRFCILIPFFLFFLPLRTILISIAEKKRIQAVSNSVVKGKNFN